MKGLVLIAPGKTAIQSIEEPYMSDNDVLLKIEQVGFCGGDLNGFLGLFPLQEYPNVLGHEVGALVLKKGTAVPDTIQVGDKVTIDPYLHCSTCVACRNGKTNACEDNKTMGVRRPGAMTERISVNWRKVHVSNKLSFKELALVEPLTVGFHAVARAGVMKKDTVLVIGCGIVGLGAISGALRMGARVIALDISESKINMARLTGAHFGINSSHTDVDEALAEFTNGDGPDVVIEAVGNDVMFRKAVDWVSFTGRVVYVGYGKKEVSYDSSLFVKKELNILGSRNCLGDFPDVIQYIEEGRFPVEAAISKTVSLQEGGHALDYWRDNRAEVTKIMLDMSL